VTGPVLQQKGKGQLWHRLLIQQSGFLCVIFVLGYGSGIQQGFEFQQFISYRLCHILRPALLPDIGKGNLPFLQLGKEKTVFGILRPDYQNFAHEPFDFLNVRNVSYGNIKVKIAFREIYESAHHRNFGKGMFRVNKPLVCQHCVTVLHESPFDTVTYTLQYDCFVHNAPPEY